MKSTRNSLIVLFSVSVMLILGACSGQRKAVVTQPEADNVPAGSLSSRFTALATSYGQWQDVSMPVKLELRSPKHFGISGRASMVRGENIYISLRMLGFEVGVVYADRDSVYLVEKLHKIVYSESLGRLTSSFGLTLTDLQDFLTGRAFVPGKGAVGSRDEKSFRHLEVGTSEAGGESVYSWEMYPVKHPESVDWAFLVESVAGRGKGGVEIPYVSALRVTPKGRESVECRYSGVMSTPAGYMASGASVSATIRGKAIEGSVQWTLRSAKWNTGSAKRDYRPPRDYKRVSTEGLFNMIKNFSF